jgi:hypothetical protein
MNKTGVVCTMLEREVESQIRTVLDTPARAEANRGCALQTASWGVDVLVDFCGDATRHAPSLATTPSGRDPQESAIPILIKM